MAPYSTPPEMNSDYENSTESGLGGKALEALVSPEQLKLLNAMDKLRAYGIGEFVSLPQIVVCGDQSAGKSSVLEAITEIQFPRKENLCTTFPTEIALRRSAAGNTATSVSVGIIPGDAERSQEERDKLSAFSRSLSSFDQLPNLIEEARTAMDPTGTGKFSKDVLSIEITGPTQPHLTVVDLPGLIHVGQGSADVELVSSLVERYMQNPRSVILAVVAATNDYQNQIVLKRAKQSHIDPKGARTLGIITKPDQIPAGSEKEEAFISLANNELIEFELGWHVVRNRRYEERDEGTASRNRREKEFFRTSAWKSIPRNSVGITALRSRLSRLLYEHIKAEFPKVCDDIRAELKKCESKLAELGEKRETVSEQRIFLTRLSMEFVKICKDAVDGYYEDPFFGGWIEKGGEGFETHCSRRLRAVVEAEKSNFEISIRVHGHTKDIDFCDGEESKANDREGLTRQEAVDWVKPLVRASRGRELPGAFNRELVSPLFHEQSKNWEAVATRSLDRVFGACREFLNALVAHLTKENQAISNALSENRLNKAINKRLAEARKELDKLFQDRRGHAMTNSPDYIISLQKAEENERQKAGKEALKKHSFYRNHSRVDQYEIEDFVRDFVAEQKQGHGDMDGYACEELLRSMLAYYKVASKTFVDNFGAQVIERHLMRGLWEGFSPVTVLRMSEEEVASIASESPVNQSLRASLERKRERLLIGLQTCLGGVA